MHAQYNRIPPSIATSSNLTNSSNLSNPRHLINPSNFINPRNRINPSNVINTSDFSDWGNSNNWGNSSNPSNPSNLTNSTNSTVSSTLTDSTAQYDEDDNSANSNVATCYLRKYGHLLDWKPHKEEVLEVGCGNGAITKRVLYPYLKNHLETLIAIDNIPELIAKAKRTNTNKKIEFGLVDISDTEDIGRITGRFDHIFSFFCVHWLLGQRAVFQNFYDLLKPGGQIFVSIIFNDNIHKSSREIALRWITYLPEQEFFSFTIAEPQHYMTRVLVEIGFEVELCQRESNNVYVEDYDGFIRSLISMHGFTQSIPKNMREEYIREHVANYRSKMEKKLNAWHEALIFIARKRRPVPMQQQF